MAIGSAQTGSVISTVPGRSVNGLTPQRPQNNLPAKSNKYSIPQRTPTLITSRPSAPAGPAAQHPRNAWGNNGGAMLKSALVNSRAPSHFQSSIIPATRPQMSKGQAPVALESQLANMNLNPSAAVYNPSMGPTPSQLTTDWRQQAVGASQASNFSNRGPVKNAVCKQSGLAKQHFKKGEIISIPFHTANMNPNADPSDPRLSFTVEGPAYAKRRMMVVLWLHRQDMFCLPLFSYSGTGLAKKQASLDEHIAVMNVGDFNFVNHGMYTPVEASCSRGKLTNTTTIHLACGIKVGYSEDICRVGRITQKSHQQLMELWQDLSERAQSEAWRS
ncbi:hypothetical protein LTR85_000594 [Meristemomyces frigidus]|nr:hypothetical protein LTR85_000594 [Meristemomyces frigidus]